MQFIRLVSPFTQNCAKSEIALWYDRCVHWENSCGTQVGKWEEAVSKKTGKGQSGGHNISGNSGQFHGPVITGDNVTLSYGPRAEEVAGEVIRQTDERRTETVDISGRWADATGSIFEIVQTGDTFRYTSLNQQNGLRSEGTGRIDGHRFSGTYRTNVPSQGTATGTVSDSGLEIIETVLDSVFGSYSLRAIRQ